MRCEERFFFHDVSLLLVLLALGCSGGGGGGGGSASHGRNSLRTDKVGAKSGSKMMNKVVQRVGESKEDGDVMCTHRQSGPDVDSSQAISEGRLTQGMTGLPV
ncbi:hypothetical protein BDP55DRAFT_712142 [Colletotrichum godetiae]|uniref:Secreted protein n=1 Tax=Colletotrichum godetiae TaxID=1209918 RepID=A0AAJ0EXC1_9PEZI|nr:uncharacterized protein BDP55DRAFT_712142 [Colletotrichum godetiae]KAK1689725.1 hypothetical protein BDP55DRAFT_712142 [Colletotrichum godetiae]